jgi:glutathione-regulated potassium-efflux system ancillary protein KefC/glutathione-regulated potassium-efflux system protein KefB
LAEKRQLTTEAGRSSFAILLFQDLAAIPALALIPFLGSTSASEAPAFGALRAVAVVAAVVLGGRYLMRPLFRAIASAKNREVFTAMSLALVMGVALLMTTVGLSMALGAFLAGVLLADSEYRHEMEADIEPFKGLLLGLFFMAVGMSLDMNLLRESPAALLGLTLAFVLSKALLVALVGRVLSLKTEASRSMGLVISQGGEFAFVLFGLAGEVGLLGEELRAKGILIVTLSMVLTPLLVLLDENVFKPLRCRSKIEPSFDEIGPGPDAPVIIAGFGRFGQMFGRVLRTQGIPFTGLDHDSEQVNLLRRFGNPIYFGDASRLDLLQAAGCARARAFVLAIADVESSLATARVVRKNFPQLPIYARARNRGHAFALLDMGITTLKRETVDSATNFTEQLLVDLGFAPEKARDIMDRFRKHDDESLLKQHAVHHDEDALLNVSRQSAQQLAELLRTDSKPQS